jgi:hypothetical protein
MYVWEKSTVLDRLELEWHVVAASELTREFIGRPADFARRGIARRLGRVGAAARSVPVGARSLAAAGSRHPIRIATIAKANILM